MKDWIMELCPEIAEWQAEIIAEQVRIRIESEREACAKAADEAHELMNSSFQGLAAAIRARGQEAPSSAP